MFSGAAASHGFIFLHGNDGGQQRSAQTHTNRITASRPHQKQGEYFKCLQQEPLLYPGFPFLGSGSLDLVEVCVRGDGCGEGDAPPASGG